MKRNRLLTKGVLAFLVAGTLAACGGSSDSGSAQPAAQSQPTSASEVSGEIDTSQVKKDLKVAVDNSHYLFHEDIFMAEKLGYFDEVGIDNVEILETEDPLPGLVGGSLDLALYDTDTTVAAAAKSNAGIKLVSIYLGGEANILGVGPGIKTPEDLKGKTVTGGQFGSRNDFLVRQALKDMGLDPEKDVNLVSTGGNSNERLQSVISGTVDAASLQIRHRQILEAEGGTFLYEEVGQVPQVGWSASKELLQDSPETVAAFHAATLKARQFITDMSNKEEVLAEAERLGFDLPEPFKAAYEDENDPQYHTADGGFEVADFDQFIEQQTELEVIPPGTEWRDHVDLTALWRAQKYNDLELRPAPDDL